MSRGPTVARVPFDSIRLFRESFRDEAGCQIVRDSILGRGLADAWEIRLAGKAIGYAGVWNTYDPGRLMEFWLDSGHRSEAEASYAAVLDATRAHEVEAQTNVPLMHEMLTHFGATPRPSHHLFEVGDEEGPARAPSGLAFRPCEPGEGEEGEWAAVRNGEVVGTGGLLTHYNPPFADVYMAVRDGHRRQGVGSWLVRQLCGLARARGQIAAARCSVENEASRRTLLRGGMDEVGQILVADVRA